MLSKCKTGIDAHKIPQRVLSCGEKEHSHPRRGARIFIVVAFGIDERASAARRPLKFHAALLANGRGTERQTGGNRCRGISLGNDAPDERTSSDDAGAAANADGQSWTDRLGGKDGWCNLILQSCWLF